MPTTYSLTPSTTTATEGTQVTFTITRSGDKPAETVYFSTLSNGTATYGEGDYSTTSGGAPSNIAVSFSSGTTSKTVTLNILKDSSADSGEQFRAIVQRNSSDPTTIYLSQSAYVTINDAPAQATTYSLTASPGTVTEGGQVTFTITRSGDKPAETIYFSTLADGSATFSEGDYSTTSGGSPSDIAVSFSSGTTSRTVTLNILNDGSSDSGEQFRAIIQRSTSDPTTTYLDRSGYVTINDAVAQGTTYSLTASTSTAIEGNQVTFTVTRSGDKPAETIYFSTLSDGTATFAEGDYTTLSGGSPANIALSFSSGETSESITLNIVNDGSSDSGEQFRAIVQRNSGDPTTTYLDRSAYVTINDAAAQSTSYSVTPSPTTVSEGGQVTFTITRSGGTPAETVYFSTLSDGTATYAEGDYATTGGGAPSNVAVSFAAGSTSRTVTLNILSDGVADSGESFRAIVQRSSGDPVTTYLSRSDFVTINDAAASATSYALTASPGTAGEGGQVTFIIARTGDKPAETIYFSTLSDGTATYAEGDYATTSGGAPSNIAVVFGAAESTKTVTLNVLNDGVADSGESFRAIVQRSTSDPVTTYLSRSDYVTINDAGQTSGTTYRLTPSSISAAEGSTLTFTVARSGTLSAETLYFSTLSDGSATFAEGDYAMPGGGAPLNIPIVFAAGDNSETVTLNILADTPDAMEQFRAIIQRSSSDPVATYLSRSDFVAITEGSAPPPPSTPDDFADTDDDISAPVKSLTLGEAVSGVINAADANDTYGDKDVFSVVLTAGEVYDFRLTSSSIGGAALPSGIFTIRNEAFNVLEESGAGPDVHKYYQAETSGLHYVRVGTGGPSSDTGGYSLLVKVAPPSTSVPDDWADAPGDAGVPGGLSPAGSRAGTLEAVGDRDYFTVELTAGKIYTFSVAAESRPGVGPIDTVALSLRGPSVFSTNALLVDDGAGRASFSFEITQSGVYYIRVGAGADTGDTGGYRVSVSAARTPPPPPPPLPPLNPALSPLEELDNFLTIAWSPGMNWAVKLFTTDDFWSSLRLILKRIGYADNLAAANLIVDKLGYLSLPFNIADTLVSIKREVDAGGDFAEAATIELTDLAVGATIDYLSKYAVPAGFALGGVVGGMIGVLIASGGGSWAYSRWGSDWVKERIDVRFDGISDYPHYSSLNATWMPFEANSTLDEDAPALPIFDEAFYRAAYPDVDAAIAQGTVGSAYAHFLTLGVDLGYKPNAGQTLTRADLAFTIVDNDPAVLGNTALFTQALGALAGDGVGDAEKAVATVLAAAAGPANNAALDATLSALAHRKALDLITNASTGAIVEAATTNFVWSESWSDGSDFGQVFNAELAAVLGTDAPASSYRIFAVASPTGSPADVLARLQAQEGWAPGAFDTYGMAEYGGLWVVIVADRTTGATVTAPGADMLAQITVYGDADANGMYAGTRSGNLHGLDGNDNLHGAAGNDRLDGGGGNDLLYLTSSAAQSAPASGTVTLQPGPEGQDKWVTSVYYGGGVDDHQLKVGGWADNYHSLIRFDLSGAGMPSQVSSATVRLYYFSNNAASPTGVLVDKVNTAWTEAYVWNDYPLGYTNLLQVSPSSFGWVDIDVTQTVNGWLANPSSNFGLQLRPTSNNNNFTFFVSSDATGDMAANRPKLVLNWGPAGAPAEADIGIGGPGNDTFLVDSALDQVIEASGEGADAVYSTVSYALAAGSEIELVSTMDREGTASIDFTGNEHDNALYGNVGANLLVGGGGNDHLDGGGGADRLRGGAGDDGYVVDDSGDVVEEFAGEGIDTVWTSLATYSLLGGQVENLGATSDAAHDFRGNAGGNVITGGDGSDMIRLHDGGDDTAIGGGGNDAFLLLGALTGADVLAGDDGTDEIVLQGDYSAGVTLGAVTDVELVVLVPGSDVRFGAPGTHFYSYRITTTEQNVAAGVQLSIDANRLRAGENLVFDGSAETDGSFYVFAGKGVDTLTGGAKNDAFLFRGPGNFTGADTVNGGAGFDELALRGDYTGAYAVTFGAATISGIEAIVVISGHDLRYGKLAGDLSFDLTMNEANVANGQVMIVDAGTLRAGEKLTFDGSAETDGGRFTMFGGKGGDVLTGGSGADSIRGGLGADVMKGNAGADTFVYRDTAESAAGGVDQILDFLSGTDRIDLSRIDANTLVGGDQAFAWIGSNAFSGSGAAGQLRAYQDGANWFVEGDTNGDGTADLVIQLTGAATIVQGDFLP